MTEPARRARLVVLEDGILAAMAVDDRYTSAFPFLKALAVPQVAGGCGKCGRKAADATARFAAAKAEIARLADDPKRRLKELLNAQQVRVTYTDPGTNRRIELTF